MTSSIYEYVLTQLAAAKGTWPKVATGSGVPLRTLEKIARREHKNPRIENIDKLYRYFQDERRIAS